MDLRLSQRCSWTFSTNGTSNTEQLALTTAKLMEKQSQQWRWPNPSWGRIKSETSSLHCWCNTPRQATGTSPAQWFFNRRTRTLLPTSENLLKPVLNLDAERLKLQDYLKKKKKNIHQTFQRPTSPGRRWHCTNEIISDEWEEVEQSCCHEASWRTFLRKLEIPSTDLILSIWRRCLTT